MAFFTYKLFPLALEYMQKSLAITTSDIEHYHTLFWIANIKLRLSDTTVDVDEKMAHVQSAYQTINTGLALYQEKEEIRNWFDGNMYRLNIVQFNLIDKATCEIRLGDIDQAIITMDQAYAAMGDIPDNSLNNDFVNEITAYLEKTGDFEKLLSVVGRFKKWDLIYWLAVTESTGHDRFQHAAWECKRHDLMVKIYDTLMNDVEKFNIGAKIRSNLASTYQFVFPNDSEAKRLLNEILERKKGIPWQDADDDFVFTARLQLADVLVSTLR